MSELAQIVQKTLPFQDIGGRPTLPQIMAPCGYPPVLAAVMNFPTAIAGPPRELPRPRRTPRAVLLDWDLEHDVVSPDEGISLEPPEQKRTKPDFKEPTEMYCMAETDREYYYHMAHLQTPSDLTETSYGERFIDLFLVKNKKRKLGYHQKVFNHRITYLFRSSHASVPFAWMVMHIRQMYDGDITRLGVECGSIWLTQAQNEENHALFPAKEDFTAFISLMWLVKSSMFVRDFSPDLDDVINSNPQYPRTVFLVPRFRKHFLLIVKKESLPDDISLRILFRFSWKDAGQGLVNIERVCDDIPPILQGLEALSGNNGQTIYERMFKGKIVKDYLV